MKATNYGVEKVKAIFGFIGTILIVTSFLFMGFLTIISLLSNSAYKKVTRGKA